MAYTDRLEWETLRSIDSATITGTFQPLGTPLLHPSYILKMVNNSTADVIISNDGTTDKDVCPAGSFWLYDEGKVGQSSAFPAMPKNSQISVRGSAGVGTVYLVSQYVIQG